MNSVTISLDDFLKLKEKVDRTERLGKELANIGGSIQDQVDKFDDFLGRVAKCVWGPYGASRNGNLRDDIRELTLDYGLCNKYHTTDCFDNCEE